MPPSKYTLSSFETRSGEFNKEKTASTTLAALQRKLAHMASTGGGVAVAVFPGLHFNDPEVTDERNALHEHYRAAVAAFTRVLAEFGGNSSCAKCDAVLLTPTSQHFSTPSGAYRASKMSMEALANATGRGGTGSTSSSAVRDCRPWQHPAARDGALQGTSDADSAVIASGETLRPSDWQLATHSANSWRAEELARAVPFRTDPRVLVVPLHWITSDWHDLHPGYRGEKYATVARMEVCLLYTSPSPRDS